MVFNMREYSTMLKDRNVNIAYSGPLWEDSIKGMAEIIRTRLSHDEITDSAAKCIFSVFVEQVTNMLMYSVEKTKYDQVAQESIEISSGMLVLGERDKLYFIQTGNIIKSDHVNLIQSRIDHLNTLDKKELRKYYRERLNSENDNPESKGAGLGLIEIARRATAPIAYSFEKVDDELTYFTMYVEIGQEKKGE